jgi:sn-glycerol 3-phosphate transport system substrate-binding protein
MKRFSLLAAAASALAVASGAQAQERIKFDYWYGLTGQLGEVMQKHCDAFNAAQARAENPHCGKSGEPFM